MDKRAALHVTSAVLTISLLAGATRTYADVAGEKPSDSTISFWVKEALRDDPRVMPSQVEVTVDDGFVTLSGEVRNLAEKNYAVLEAKKINGVRGVINKVVVRPTYRPDADITRDIRLRALGSASVKVRNLDVTCLDGEARLAGQVATWTERQEAELLASEVRGVRKIDNALTVEYPAYRTDEAIRADASAAIRRDVYLSGLPITVTVKDGIVTLQGAVGTAYQKHRAVNEVRFVGNVKAVKDDLSVDWWEKRGVREETPLPTDSQLKKDVRDELYKDFRVTDPFEIAVDASIGHITLRGTVGSHHQKNLAEQDAREVVGVGAVTNYIMVRADRREDDAIRKDIEAQFDSDYLLSGQNVEIRVHDGTVTLSGDVNSSYERSHAMQVASRVMGVTDVHDNIAENKRRAKERG